MKKPLLVPLIVVSLLFVVAVGFGVWAFQSRQDYKYNSDQKAAAAAVVASQKTSTAKDNAFALAEKQPLKAYNGPSAYGSVIVKYPKTWSAYVIESNNTSSSPISGYFQPNFVPGTSLSTSIYALRLQVVSNTYDQVAQNYQSIVKQGKLVATPYIPAHNPTVTGLRLDGQLTSTINGSMVILPLRDKTLELWTESPSFVNDFNTNILPNFSFSQ